MSHSAQRSYQREVTGTLEFGSVDTDDTLATLEATMTPCGAVPLFVRNTFCVQLLREPGENTPVVPEGGK